MAGIEQMAVSANLYRRYFFPLPPSLLLASARLVRSTLAAYSILFLSLPQPFLIFLLGFLLWTMLPHSDLDFWANVHGHRFVPIELGDMQRGGMKERIMRMDAFVSSYLKPSSDYPSWSLKMATSNQEKSQVAYLAQHQLFEQMSDLLDDIVSLPSLCGEAGPTHVNAWVGTGGTRTPLHFDSYDNLFVQVFGVKYVRIYSHSETEKLYVIQKNDATSSHGAQGNMSAVDCELEDYDAHPNSQNAKYTEVIMMPGDCLFIPARAWHYVRSLSTSASVNFWF